LNGTATRGRGSGRSGIQHCRRLLQASEQCGKRVFGAKGDRVPREDEPLIILQPLNLSPQATDLDRHHRGRELKSQN
jgi:hypothetical protein